MPGGFKAEYVLGDFLPLSPNNPILKWLSAALNAMQAPYARPT
jgi:hypothetical protein